MMKRMRNSSAVWLAAVSMAVGFVGVGSARAQDSTGGMGGGTAGGGSPSTMPNTAAPGTATPETAAPGMGAPSTRPSVAVDPSTPRGALKTLLTAMQNGDGTTIHNLMTADTSTEKKMIDSMASRAEIELKFRKAAEGKFGVENAKQLVGDTDAAGAAMLAQIDAADEKVDGESATVSTAGQPELKLKRVEGKWKVPASEFAKNVNPTEVEKGLDEIAFQAKLISTYADDVSAGKYKTVEEARDGIRAQMMTELMKRQSQNAPPTTEPSDGTTTAPPTTQPK